MKKNVYATHEKSQRCIPSFPGEELYFVKGYIWDNEWCKNVVTIQSWWRHQMEPFSVLLALCAGNSPVTGEVPSQRPVTRSFDVFFDLRLNKRLSKQSGRRWIETPLWRHCNGGTLGHIRVWICRSQICLETSTISIVISEPFSGRVLKALRDSEAIIL